MTTKPRKVIGDFVSERHEIIRACMKDGKLVQDFGITDILEFSVSGTDIEVEHVPRIGTTTVNSDNVCEWMEGKTPQSLQVNGHQVVEDFGIHGYLKIGADARRVRMVLIQGNTTVCDA